MYKSPSYYFMIAICLALITVVIANITHYFSPIMLGAILGVVFFFSQPRYLFSLKSITLAYYGLWFFIAPIFATRYANLSNTSKAEITSYTIISLCYLTIMITLFIKERSLPYPTELIKKKNDQFIRKKHLFISGILLSFFFVVYFIKTGSFESWFITKGLKYSFLKRGGSGFYYLSFILTSNLFFFLCSVYAYQKKQIRIIYITICVILLLYPFIGSKAKVLYFLFQSVFIYSYNKKLKLKYAFSSVLVFLLILFIGSYIRNTDWIKITTIIPYTLNYFDTYENLLKGIQDFSPSFMQTTPLLANKILEPFGYSPGLFYDMSHFLTSIYIPQTAQMRATVQWPIEMDLYLNYYFYLGLPLLAISVSFLTEVFKRVILTNKIEYIFVYCFIFFSFISHLRGGLFIWTDFYTIPFLVISFFYIKIISSNKMT